MRHIFFLLLMVAVLTACGSAAAEEPVPIATPTATAELEPSPTIDPDRPGVTIKLFKEKMADFDIGITISNERIYPIELEDGPAPLHKPGIVYEAAGRFIGGIEFELYEFDTIESANKVQSELDAADLESPDHFTNGYLMMWVPDKENREKYRDFLMSITP